MKLYKFNEKTLQYEHTKTWNLRLGILVACVFLVMGFGSAVKVNTIVERIPVVLTPRTDACTDENVIAYIDKIHLKHQHIVWQQTVIESAHYTSPYFKMYNNVTGMHACLGRPSTGTNIDPIMASYDNWKESLIDYGIWQAAYASNIESDEDYYYFLDKVYCTTIVDGKTYSQRLKQIK